MQKEHENYMQQCLRLAKVALATGNPPVGALLVYKGEVIGKGVEAGRSTGDVTNHAEIVAVRNAIDNGYLKQLHLATMYTTHEPCLMCSYVIRHHKISKIVYGTSVPLVGGATSKFNILSTQDVPKWGDKPTIISGVYRAECDLLSEEFRKANNL
ncbi:nucleoside deaminase [Mucilaginibacter conchicola]|nr:nucleoside deaminase [Mucilaginibacter conchicola]